MLKFFSSRLLHSPSKETMTTFKKPKRLTPMMKQYFELKEAHPGYLLLFRMGDFYEMFYEDAVKAAQALDITLTKRGKQGGLDIPMAGVPHHALDNYLERLVKQGHLVAVAEQVQNDTSSSSSEKIMKRQVQKLVTPGTLMEDKFLNPRLNNYLAAISPHHDSESFGLSWIDISTAEFHTTFLDSNSALNAELARILPSEVLIPDYKSTIQTDTKKKRMNLTSFSKTISSSTSPFHISPVSEEHFLPQPSLLTSLTSMSPTLINRFSNIELSSMSALLWYITQTQREKLPYLRPPQQWSGTNVMSIDSSTRRSLELSRSMSTGERTGSTLSVLDETCTPAGARLLASRLHSPLTSIPQIEARLDLVQYFQSQPRISSAIVDALKSCSDLERSLQRASVSRASARDLSAIGSTLGLAADILDILTTQKALQKKPQTYLALASAKTKKMKEKEKEKREKNQKKAIHSNCTSSHALEPIIHQLSNIPSKLAELLEQAIVDSSGSSNQLIKPGYSEELDRSRSLRDRSQDLIKELSFKYKELTNIASLKIKHNFLLGHFIEIPLGQKSKMEEYQSHNNNNNNNNDDDDDGDKDVSFRHIQTLSGSMRFKSTELTDLEIAISNASQECDILERSIFNEINSQVISLAPEITEVARSLASIDVSISLATVAAKYGYTRPRLSEEPGKFLVEGGRHVVVEASQIVNGNSFVANDLRLAEGDQAKLWILTGPNMGGKSTFLRQNALIAILAQLGSFVPASHVELGVIDKLFSRVGASDDLAQDQSTFMVEMVETAAILADATPKSFVIMDEIGRGTSTADGLAIAKAIVLYLHEQIQCRTLFATHYHELADLAPQLPDNSFHTTAVSEEEEEENGENGESMIMFHRTVVPGVASKSYGIQVAKLAGLPSKVIRAAQDFVKLK